MQKEHVLPRNAKLYRAHAGEKDLYLDGRTLPAGTAVLIGAPKRLLHGAVEHLAVPICTKMLCGNNYFLLTRDIDLEIVL